MHGSEQTLATGSLVPSKLGWESSYQLQWDNFQVLHNHYMAELLENLVNIMKLLILWRRTACDPANHLASYLSIYLSIYLPIYIYIYIIIYNFKVAFCEHEAQ